MEKKHPSLALAAALLACTSVATDATAGFTTLGNPQTGASFQITSPIRWTATETGIVSFLVLDEAMSTPDGNLTQTGVFGSTPDEFSLKNLSTGGTMVLTTFIDGNAAFNDVSEGDSHFSTTAGLAITTGDIIELAETGVGSLGFAPEFDADWANYTFTGNTFLSDFSGNTIAVVPEPSSSLLLGLVTMGCLARRRKTR